MYILFTIYKLIWKQSQPNATNHKEEQYTISGILNWDDIFGRLLGNINNNF